MRTSELMVGDWVKIKDQPKLFPMQIVAEHFVRSLEDFEPIPLTEEILKINGYEEIIYGILTLRVSNKIIDYCVSTCELFIYSRSGLISKDLEFGCKYVHELQHALRLCDFNELADNIKIQ